jgi:hypothetical protein
MSLYGRTDSNANVTKAGRGIAATSQAKQVIFVDETEAQLEANKERGLNAPGWWSYFSYTDASGATRHKAEQMVFIANADGTETQADDATAADVAVLITINSLPASVAVSEGAALSIVLDAISTPPGDASLLSYQWQKKSGRRWVDIAGATNTTYDVAAYAAADDAGQYRVKINSSNGAPEVISDVVPVTTA